MPGGFPLSREYRVFLYGQDILAYSYYWDEYLDMWIIIEVADAQFAGLSQVNVLELWSKIKDITISLSSDEQGSGK
jgi:hypothetical protein